MNNGAMLNLYPDSLGGNLSATADLLESEAFRGAFRSLYILPSLFRSDLDRGFSVISYDPEPSMALPQDLERLKRLGLDLKLDFVLNHLSVLSPQFQDLLKNGEASEYHDFFIDWNRFWQGLGDPGPDGVLQPFPELIRSMHFRKKGLPVLTVRFPDGKRVPYWNTFYQKISYAYPVPQDLSAGTGLSYTRACGICEALTDALRSGKTPAEADLPQDCRQTVLDWMDAVCIRYLGQMDLNLNSEKVWDFYRQVLGRLKALGASIVRLDAFAYAPKAPGRRNFMNEPETEQTLDRIRGMADPLEMQLLPEIHAGYGEKVHEIIARAGYMVYDFFLPGLIIDALEQRDGSVLAAWAREQREKGIRTVNMLGCHDGIPLLDLKGLLPDERIRSLIGLVVSRGGMVKNLHGQTNIYYQVNAAYFSALGADERKLLLARAIQLFMPGKPQIWYLDLFAGANAMDLVEKAGPGGHKEINRRNLTLSDIKAGLKKQVVRDQLALLRFRNSCPAFSPDSVLTADTPEPGILRLRHTYAGVSAELRADFASGGFTVSENGNVIFSFD